MVEIVISEELTDWTITHRRHFHQYPELSGEEFETCQYIKEILKDLGIEILDYKAPSVVGLLKAKNQEQVKTIALRADIDALPIQEENDLSYRSKVPGVSHMCGHDGHTAILLATAKWLVEHQEQLSLPNIIFIFQSSEEDLPSGAEKLVKEGVMEGVDAVFGLHLSQGLPKGQIGIAHGAMNAAADDFTITIQGKGGHGASPHLTIDPTYVAGHIIIALQSIVSRKLDPMERAVISIGSLKAGEAHNVIPETVTLKGTLRSLTPEVRNFVSEQMTALVEQLCHSFQATGKIEFGWGAPPVINDRSMSQLAEQVVVDQFGKDALFLLEPTMGGEDFSYYLEEKKGAYVNIGMGGEKSKYPHHHPKFNIDEESLPIAIKFYLHLIQYFQRSVD